MPAAYTHGHHESVLRSHRWRTAENSAAYLLPHLSSGLSLLDVGSGPGTITADLATRVGQVTATEVTADALELTRAGLAEAGVADVRLVVADVQDLDLADDSFDVVHAHQVLQHVADPVRALREMRRVARPGGLVAVRDSDYGAFCWWPDLSALDDWRDLYRRVARANGGEPDAGRRLLSWARAAGLDRVEATSSTWCFATPQEREWWGGMWSDRVLRSELARHALDSGAATQAELEAISAGWTAWAASDDGWFSLLHAEVLARV